MLRFCISFLLAALLLRAEPADWILSARYLVTMDAARRVIENGAIAIMGERIVAVGTRADISKRFQAKSTVYEANAILAPGLINTHTHAAMSLFRGIADDLKLQDWLEKYIFPAEAKNVNAEFVRWGTRLACLEMLLSGTTTYTDMYYFEEVVAEETKRAGMRGVLGETIIGFPVAGREDSGGCFEAHRGFPAAVRQGPADCRRCRAACGLYEFGRDAEGIAGSGEQVRCAAA